jgi:hypothetical protein
MRYNDFKNDPLASHNPMHAICSRGDLQDKPTPGGCYDTKVTSNVLAKSQTSFAVNGPTRSHGLPAFSWSGFQNYSHLGMPDTYDFNFVKMTPIF